MNDPVVEFIKGFHKYDNDGVIYNTFLNGYCYYFAVILKERFGGEILYDPGEGHFVTRIVDDQFHPRLYDVTGDVSLEHDWSILLDKTDWIKNGRVIRGCILKGDNL